MHRTDDSLFGKSNECSKGEQQCTAASDSGMHGEGRKCQSRKSHVQQEQGTSASKQCPSASQRAKNHARCPASVASPALAPRRK
eukprot:5979335-Pleurochrysis_carterae.AAC.2